MGEKLVRGTCAECGCPKTAAAWKKAKAEEMKGGDDQRNGA